MLLNKKILFLLISYSFAVYPVSYSDVIEYITGLNNTNPRTGFDQYTVSGAQNLIEVFLKEGGDINANFSSGLTFLMLAVRAGRVNSSLINYLIEKNANVNMQDEYETTALIFAARSHSESIGTVMTLIRNGADYSIEKYGMNALEWCEANGGGGDNKILDDVEQRIEYLWWIHIDYRNFIYNENKKYRNLINDSIASMPNEISSLIAGYSVPTYNEYFEIKKRLNFFK